MAVSLTGIDPAVLGRCPVAGPSAAASTVSAGWEWVSGWIQGASKDV